MQKNFEKQKFIFCGILSATTEKAKSGSVSKWYGSADPDPYQKNVTDPQHWLTYTRFYVYRSVFRIFYAQHMPISVIIFFIPGIHMRCYATASPQL